MNQNRKPTMWNPENQILFCKTDRIKLEWKINVYIII